MKKFIRCTMTAAVSAHLCLGCGDPLKEAQRIEEPRVLGVRIDNESGSSQVAPGESIEVDLLLAGPTGPINAEVAFRVCLAGMSDRGVPKCSGTPFLEGTARASDFPFSAELPEGATEGERIVVLGVACVDSEPSLGDAPLDSSCGGDDPPLRFSFETTVASGSERNENPDLSQVVVELSDAALPLDDVDAPPSCDVGVASVAADETHDLRVELGPFASESGEQLQVSLFSTEGHLERQFTFLDEGETSFSLEFRAGESVEALKHYLVVRDSRGGVSWTSWSFCQR